MSAKPRHDAELSGRADWDVSGEARMTDKQRRMLNADEARELLNYDPASGVLRWKRDMTTWTRAGDEAGVVQEGKYRRVGIRGRYYMAHRLAWLIVTGHFPEHEIDHVNGKKADNRWVNLRAATATQNRRNTRHENRSGLIGASYHAGTNRYRAQIRVDGIRIFLGWFQTAEEASAAYVAAAIRHHGEFTPCRK